MEHAVQVSSFMRQGIPLRKRHHWGKLLLIGTMPVISFGLGYWQLERLEWKNNLVRGLNEDMEKPPVELGARLT